MSYPSSPLSPYLGGLELQFSPGPFYKFVALSLMVLYQLESFHLDNYNLIYIQNKNRGFFQNFDNISFENSTFSLFTNTTQNQSKTIPTNNTKKPQKNPKTHLQQKKTLFIHIWGFPQLKHKNKGVWVYFLPQISSNLQCQAFFLFLITLGFDFHGAIHKSPHSKTLALSLFFKNAIAQMSSP